MNRRRRSIIAAVSALALSCSVASVAEATQSVTNSFKCSITSLAPRLSGTTIIVSANVVCAKAATVIVDIKGVEMDGTVEQASVVMAENKTMSVSVLAGKTVTVQWTGTCVNTETGYEEFATKARVGIGTKYSSYDRTSPASNSHNC